MQTWRKKSKRFSNYQSPIDLFINLRDGNADPREVLKNQIDFKWDLGEIRKGNPKSKSEDQISVIKIFNFFYLRGKVINFYRDYYILLPEAKYKAKDGKGLKILTPKQMFQRLPIAIAQVKAGNTCEKLLNEIRQFIYSLSSKRSY